MADLAEADEALVNSLFSAQPPSTVGEEPPSIVGKESKIQPNGSYLSNEAISEIENCRNESINTSAVPAPSSPVSPHSVVPVPSLPVSPHSSAVPDDLCGTQDTEETGSFHSLEPSDSSLSSPEPYIPSFPIMDHTTALYDEIALEGLEGSTLPALWTNLEFRSQNYGYLTPEMKSSSAETAVHYAENLDLVAELGHSKFYPTEGAKAYLWRTFIIKLEGLEFYLLPEERPDYLELLLDAEKKKASERVIHPFVEIFPLVEIYVGKTLGSCPTYKRRKRITSLVRAQQDFDKAMKEWGRRLVIVASQERRLMSLTQEYSQCGGSTMCSQTSMVGNLYDLGLADAAGYAFLEYVGRTRRIGLSSYSLKKKHHTNKKLLSFGLIVRQIAFVYATDRRTGKLVNDITYCLPQFVRPVLSLAVYQHLRAEKLLLEYPGRRLPRAKLVSMLGGHSKRVLVNLPKTYFSVYTTIEKGKRGRREVFAVRLRRRLGKDALGRYVVDKESDSEKAVRDQSVVQEEDLGDSDDDEEKIADTSEESLGSGFSDCMAEVHRQIVLSGSEGMSIFELAAYVGLGYMDARCLHRRLLDSSLYEVFYVSSLKTKLRKLRIKGCHNAEAIETKASESTSKVIVSTGATNNPTDTTTSVEYCSSLETSINNIVLPAQILKMGTPRSNFRAKFMVHQVMKYHVVQYTDLYRALRDTEIASGEGVTMDRKSGRRILVSLSDCKLLFTKTHEIRVGTEEDPKVKKVEVVCKPGIKDTDEELMRVLDRVKLSLSVDKEDRVKKEPEQVRPKLESDPDAFLLYGYKPKMNQKELVHKILVYLVYMMNNEAAPVREASDYEPAVYADESSWKRYMTPRAVTGGDLGSGWIQYCDVNGNLPICVFAAIKKIMFKIPGLMEDFLSDPVKRYTPIKLLPTGMLAVLNIKHALIHLIRELSLMGLISIKKKDHIRENPSSLWFYVHRYATLYDTTSSEKAYTKTSVKDYPHKVYDFCDGESASEYWSDLQKISQNTPLGLRLAGDGARAEPSKDIRIRQSDLFKLISDRFEEKGPVDDGSLPGDGRGAGGFDSSLFMHRMQNWKVQQCLISGFGTTDRMSTVFEKNGSYDVEMTSRPASARAGRKRTRAVPSEESGRKKRVRKDPKFIERSRFGTHDDALVILMFVTERLLSVECTSADLKYVFDELRRLSQHCQITNVLAVRNRKAALLKDRAIVEKILLMSQYAQEDEIIAQYQRATADRTTEERNTAYAHVFQLLLAKFRHELTGTSWKDHVRPPPQPIETAAARPARSLVEDLETHDLMELIADTPTGMADPTSVYHVNKATLRTLIMSYLLVDTATKKNCLPEFQKILHSYVSMPKHSRIVDAVVGEMNREGLISSNRQAQHTYQISKKLDTHFRLIADMPVSLFDSVTSALVNVATSEEDGAAPMDATFEDVSLILMGQLPYGKIRLSQSVRDEDDEELTTYEVCDLSVPELPQSAAYPEETPSAEQTAGELVSSAAGELVSSAATESTSADPFANFIKDRESSDALDSDRNDSDSLIPQDDEGNDEDDDEDEDEDDDELGEGLVLPKVHINFDESLRGDIEKQRRHFKKIAREFFNVLPNEPPCSIDDCTTGHECGVVEACRALYQSMEERGWKGISKKEIFEQLGSAELVTKCLDVLMEAGLVYRVGVSSFIYVTFAGVQYWSAVVYKNTRGRTSDPQQPSEESITKTSDEAGNVSGKRQTKAPDRLVEQEIGSATQPSSYKAIRVIPRPWKTIGGIPNHATFRDKLGIIIMLLYTKGGSSAAKLATHFGMLCTNVELLELLELFEKLEILTIERFTPFHAPTLFSEASLPTPLVPGTTDGEMQDICISVSPDCVLRYGMFLQCLKGTQLTYLAR